MTKTGLDGTEPYTVAGDIAWRHIWLTNVLLDAGKLGPVRLVRREMPMRKDSLARRLHRLRRMRAALDLPR